MAANMYRVGGKRHISRPRVFKNFCDDDFMQKSMEANRRSDTVNLMKGLIRYKLIVKMLRFLIHLVEFDIRNVVLMENHNF